LLMQADNGKSQSYGHRPESMTEEAIHSADGTSLNSSITNRLTPQTTSKDTFLKSLAVS